MKKIFLFILLIALASLFLIVSLPYKTESKGVPSSWWEFQSIDTMKYSRDLAREKLGDPSFDLIINQQVNNIANTGVTHIALATPYDEEFYPILKRWVDAARKNNLKVWFRGNWSGWEEWFEYDSITREEHMQKTKNFVLKHKNLFQDGDIFSACPECENGGPGDPRITGDVKGHRKFLIDEHKIVQEAFKQIGKNVSTSYNSMNGDVAKLIMDKPTTKELGGIVVIDHYVKDPDQLSVDVKNFAEVSGGKVVLGEFGAPIPDIHGDMTPEEQAEWLKRALTALEDQEELLGLNYWTNTGSSTNLWDENGNARPAVDVLKKFYKAPLVSGVVKDEAGSPVVSAYVDVEDKFFLTNTKGEFSFPAVSNKDTVKIEATGFKDKEIALDDLTIQSTVVLQREKEDILFKLRKFFQSFLTRYK